MTGDVEEWALRAAGLLAALGIPARAAHAPRVTLRFAGRDMRGLGPHDGSIAPMLHDDSIALMLLAECCTALGWRCVMPDYEIAGDGWVVPADPAISIGEALARALDAHVRGT